MVDEKNPDVYAYTRSLGGTKYLVLLNFRATPSTLNLNGLDVGKAKLVIDNYGDIPGPIGELRPYEAAIYCLSALNTS